MQKRTKTWWESKTARKYFFYFYLSLVLFTTLLPSKELKQSFTDGFIFNGADKIVHVLLFFFLAFFYDGAFEQKISSKTIVLIIIGLCIEVLQEKLNWGRSFEWNDLLADVLGALSYFFIKKIKA